MILLMPTQCTGSAKWAQRESCRVGLMSIIRALPHSIGQLTTSDRGRSNVRYLEKQRSKAFLGIGCSSWAGATGMGSGKGHACPTTSSQKGYGFQPYSDSSSKNNFPTNRFPGLWEFLGLAKPGYPSINRRVNWNPGRGGSMTSE